MRVEVSNLAAADFNFQSILLSKSLFAENITECPQESQSRRKREQKLSLRKSRKRNKNRNKETKKERKKKS
jgi:hypothetical protein